MMRCKSKKKKRESGNDPMTKSGNLTLAEQGAGEGDDWGKSLAFILMNTGVLTPLRMTTFLSILKK